MKFSEMPYARPDLEALRALAAETVAKLDGAKTAQEQLDAYAAWAKAINTVETMSTLAYVRHTIDTRDEFYDQEQTWMDEVSPQFQEMMQQVNLALLRSPFRQELGDKLGRKVKIVTGKRRGRLELEYYGVDDLNDLLEALGRLQKHQS